MAPSGSDVEAASGGGATLGCIPRDVALAKAAEAAGEVGTASRSWQLQLLPRRRVDCGKRPNLTALSTRQLSRSGEPGGPAPRFPTSAHGLVFSDGTSKPKTVDLESQLLTTRLYTPHEV